MTLQLPAPKAYSYTRLSTQVQLSGDGVRRQLETARAYAAANGLGLDESSYKDLGISAFDRSNIRKGALAAFIVAVEEGKVRKGSYLLVESLDRISRSDAMFAVGLLSQLIESGITVVAVKDGVGTVYDKETIKDSTVLLLAVLTFIRANEESETKSNRVKAAHQKKRDSQDSFAFGQGPGWLTPNESKTGWEPIPEKVESVRRVFELTAKGFGSTYIAKLANEEGWPVPAKAADWHKNLPNKLINNRRVMGEFSPSVMVDGVRVPTGDVWPNYYPQVVTEENFLAAQAAVTRRQSVGKRRDNGYHNIFQGLIRCGTCGATFARKSKGGKKNSLGYALYVCSDRERGLSSCEGWNARELENCLIPGVIGLLTRETESNAAYQAAHEQLLLEQEGLRLDKSKRDDWMMVIEARTPGTMPMPGVVERLEALEQALQRRKDRIRVLTAQVADFKPPESGEYDMAEELKVQEALDAVADPTDSQIKQREALHQSLLRFLTRIDMWPHVQAHITLRDGRKLLVPFARQSIFGAMDRAIASAAEAS